MLVLNSGCCGAAGDDWSTPYGNCVGQLSRFNMDTSQCDSLKASVNPFVEWAAKLRQVYQDKAAEIVAQSSTEADIKKTLAISSDPQTMAETLIAQGAPPDLVWKLLSQTKPAGQSMWSSGLIALTLIAGGVAAYYGYSRSYGSVPSTVGYGAAGAVMPLLALSAWKGLRA